MTTEVGKSDAPRAAERRGLSRREMIRASALAGAAAWTAPVIVDSLASPAAAASGCGNRYYVKLVGRGTGTFGGYDPGDCYYAAPLCSSGTKVHTGGNTPNSSTCTAPGGGYTWVCTSGSPPNNHTDNFPTFVDSNPGHPATGTYTVTLASGCTFSSSETTYEAVGNYDWSGFGGTCEVVTPSSTTIVNFPKADGSGRVLDYMYMEFVCT